MRNLRLKLNFWYFLRLVENVKWWSFDKKMLEGGERAGKLLSVFLRSSFKRHKSGACPTISVMRVIMVSVLGMQVSHQVLGTSWYSTISFQQKWEIWDYALTVPEGNTVMYLECCKYCLFMKMKLSADRQSSLRTEKTTSLLLELKMWNFIQVRSLEI